MISGRAWAKRVADKMAAVALLAFFLGCFLAFVIGGARAVIQSLAEDRELRVYRELGGIVTELNGEPAFVKYKGEFYGMIPLSQSEQAKP